MYKCDLCKDKITQCEEPACVTAFEDRIKKIIFQFW